jgi:hypothetical protein
MTGLLVEQPRDLFALFKTTHALILKHTFTFTFIKTLKLVKNVLQKLAAAEKW